MKNIRAYIAGAIMAVFGLVPPIYFSFDAPSEYWPWWIVMAGFAGFYTLFLNISPFIKVIAVGGFINCFFSTAPFISFTAYISLVACCYFYILCKNIKDYVPVFKILQCLLFFVGFMFIMQFFGMDRLLNFGRSRTFDGNYCFGVVGQHMQSGSFSVILAAALLPFSWFNISFPIITSLITNSAGTFLCSIVGFLSWIRCRKIKISPVVFFGFFFTIFLLWINCSNKFYQNFNYYDGRSFVWYHSLRMAWEHPFAGWGMSTYKVLFPALGGIKSIPWKTAHNCWIQIIFEFGYIGFFVVLSYFGYLFISLWKLTRRASHRVQAYKCLAGLAMISVNMMFHFPSRMIQTVLIIIFFLAYCESFIGGSHYGFNKS